MNTTSTTYTVEHYDEVKGWVHATNTTTYPNREQALSAIMQFVQEKHPEATPKSPIRYEAINNLRLVRKVTPLSNT